MCSDTVTTDQRAALDRLDAVEGAEEVWIIGNNASGTLFVEDEDGWVYSIDPDGEVYTAEWNRNHYRKGM